MSGDLHIGERRCYLERCLDAAVGLWVFPPFLGFMVVHLHLLLSFDGWDGCKCEDTEDF